MPLKPADVFEYQRAVSKQKKEAKIGTPVSRNAWAYVGYGEVAILSSTNVDEHLLPCVFLLKPINTLELFSCHFVMFAGKCALSWFLASWELRQEVPDRARKFSLAWPDKLFNETVAAHGDYLNPLPALGDPVLFRVQGAPVYVVPLGF